MCLHDYKSYDIFVVLIINCKEVYWELFSSRSTIKDILKRLYRHYHVYPDCRLVTRDNITLINLNDKIKKYIDNDLNAIDIKVYT